MPGPQGGLLPPPLPTHPAPPGGCQTSNQPHRPPRIFLHKKNCLEEMKTRRSGEIIKHVDSNIFSRKWQRIPTILVGKTRAGSIQIEKLSMYPLKKTGSAKLEEKRSVRRDADLGTVQFLPAECLKKCNGNVCVCRSFISMLKTLCENKTIILKDICVVVFV